MNHQRQVIAADLIYADGAFHHGWQMAVEADGRIAQIGPLDFPVTTRLEGQAVLPGMINVHSHAFQRGLRGYGEDFPEGAGDFWTWREAMYRLVESLDAGSFHDLCVRAFREMLLSGITTVGEFHYLHHDSTCQGYAFDDVILKAASQAGIRICLLCSYYKTGGVGEALHGGQRRFHTPDVPGFLRHVDGLRTRYRRPMLTFGLAPHSIRAVERHELAALADYARHHGLVLHMHVEEQPKEIEDSIAAYGATPMALVIAEIQPDPRFTAIHCTQSRLDDLLRLGAMGANVCHCPLTEGNLGDGIGEPDRFIAEGGYSCLGTDSNLRLDFTEEMRWLEYVQRLKHERRGMFRDSEGRTGNRLWRVATKNGARALNVEAGELAVGRWADFFSLDLSHPTLVGWTEATLLDSFIFGSGREAIGRVCVGGRWVSE